MSIGLKSVNAFVPHVGGGRLGERQGYLFCVYRVSVLTTLVAAHPKHLLESIFYAPATTRGCNSSRWKNLAYLHTCFHRTYTEIDPERRRLQQ